MEEMTYLERAVKAEAEVALMKEALERILAIEDELYGGDWDEIDQARAIAKVTLNTMRETLIASQDLEQENRLNANEVIERFCALQQEVVDRYIGYENESDCFCGKGGSWKSEGYGGTFEEGYRNSGEALEFIEAAVREKLDSLGR